jgi:ankyrin repeat protein
MQPEFQHAARFGDVSAIEDQLGAGVDVNSLDPHGQTALMLAAHGGFLDVVEALIKRGARLNVTGKYGLSALMLAIVAGHENVAFTLVRAGADLTLLGTGAPGFSGKSAYDLGLQQGMKDLCRMIAESRDAAV